jgi:YHS domain-containing protein
MDVVTSPGHVRSIPFDPVCGSPIPAPHTASPYCDGGYTYYFCSPMCRRLFLDQKSAERRPDDRRGSKDAKDAARRPS